MLLIFVERCKQSIQDNYFKIKWWQESTQRKKERKKEKDNSYLLTYNNKADAKYSRRTNLVFFIGEQQFGRMGFVEGEWQL